MFVILRQNHYSNAPLFDAFPSDLGVVSSRIVAHECLAILTTPLLVPSSNRSSTVTKPGRSVVDRLTGRFWLECADHLERKDQFRTCSCAVSQDDAGRPQDHPFEALLRGPLNRAHAP